MSTVVPPNLNEVYKNLTGFRKSLVRFYPDRSGSINPSDVLRWTLPKEILLMDTLMKYFEITTTNAGTNTATEKRASCFPRNSSSIIDTITVFINGQVFENITSYNHLFNLIMIILVDGIIITLVFVLLKLLIHQLNIQLLILLVMQSLQQFKVL